MLFKGSPELESERLLLRKIKPDDYKIAYALWCIDPDQVLYTVHGIHENIDVTKSVFDKWIDAYSDEQTMRWIIELKKDKSPIGMIDISNKWAKFSAVSPGYIIAKKYWGNGYATEATKRVMKFLFDECKIETFYGEFMEDNKKSGKVMQKCGMIQDGCLKNRCEDKNGKRQNIISMSITKEEYYNKI